MIKRIVRFVFGFDAHPKLVALAQDLEENAYSYLERRPKYQIKTVPRQMPERVKAGIVQARGYETIHTMEEWVAELTIDRACKRAIAYRGKCKRLEVEQKGQLVLRPNGIAISTSPTTVSHVQADEIVSLVNGRCNQRT